jgi:hypothetical protein
MFVCIYEPSSSSKSHNNADRLLLLSWYKSHNNIMSYNITNMLDFSIQCYKDSKKMVDSFGSHEIRCCIGWIFLPMRRSLVVPSRYMVNLYSSYTVQIILWYTSSWMKDEGNWQKLLWERFRPNISEICLSWLR